MNNPIDQRTWSTMYVVRRHDGVVLHVQKSNDGCTRTVVVSR